MHKEIGDLKIWSTLLITFLAYPAIAHCILRWLSGSFRSQAFAVCNVIFSFAAMMGVFATANGFDPELLRKIVKTAAPMYAFYVALVLLNYWLLRQSVTKKQIHFATAAYLAPIIELIVIKYLPGIDSPFQEILRLLKVEHISALFIGLSYVSFRLTFLVQEVSNGQVELPSAWDYLSFAFFVPTLSVGPISPYSKFRSFLGAPNRSTMPVGRCLGRIVVGLWKYTVLANIVGHLSYSSLILDGHAHGVFDLLVSIFTYGIFLYCNFSGMCDIVIGVSGLIGIEVMENFDQPFKSRNFQEFWSRWHISLSGWLRDMMFTPLVKVLARKWGAKHSNHAIAVAIMSVFITIGIWHGAGLNFLIFGILQGLGVATVHYSTIYTKKRLGKAGFAKYRENRLYYYLGCVATFAYFSITLIFFANTMDSLSQILHVIRSG